LCSIDGDDVSQSMDVMEVGVDGEKSQGGDCDSDHCSLHLGYVDHSNASSMSHLRIQMDWSGKGSLASTICL